MIGETEAVLATGDLSRLTEEQRVAVYARTCEALGLNPVTRPLEYLRLGGRLVLYLRKEATDQLRRLHNVSIEILSMRTEGDLFICHASARLGDRVDEEVGIVSVKGLTGEALAIAHMRALSKAKRRVTLSIVGLGVYDDDDVVTVAPREIAMQESVPELPGESLDSAIRRWQDFYRANPSVPSAVRLSLLQRHRSGTLTPADVDDAIADAERQMHGGSDGPASE